MTYIQINPTKVWGFQRMEKEKRDSKAWCPDCGDEMFIEQKQLKPYEHWTHYCFGCDKYFQLKEVSGNSSHD